MKTTLKLLSILLVFTALSSCKKDKKETAEAKFTVKEKNTAAKSLKKLPSTVSFDFTRAVVGVKKVKFEREVNGDDQDYKYKGNYSFDILTGTSTPPLPTVEIEPGVYHKLKVKFDNVLPTGNTLEIDGTATVGGVNFKFEFTSKDDTEYEVENPSGLPVNPGDAVTFVLQIDLESLFTGVDFATATVDADGVIRINENSNSNLQDLIEENFDDVMDFDED